MSNVTVTMLKSGRTDDWGRPLVAGSSYSLDFDRAKSLWQAGFASVADPSIFDDSSLPFDGGIIRYAKPPGFRRSLLASLVASTTASRTNGLVTVAATSHGITTGATYVGFRFFYPGSANLVAGWYDSIVEVANANTLTFTAPGPDFASESVNGAAAYTTLTAFITMTLPALTFKPGNRLTVNVFRSGDTSATAKNIRGVLGAFNMGLGAVTTAPHGTHRISIYGEEGNKQLCSSSVDGATAGSLSSTNLDPSAESILSVSGNAAAAAAFLAIHHLTLEFAQ